MKQQVNLFFSCDDNYIPFLSATLHSIVDNCDKTRSYFVSVLHTGISEKHIEKITTYYTRPYFTVKFYDISEAVHRISERLHTRDYYSKSTYYRLFIPELFPDLDKALYLDCDIIVTGDINELYDTALGDNLVGAVTDGFVITLDDLAPYVLNRVGVDEREDYFNAGVLLMNLDKMRKEKFSSLFTDLLSSVKFTVAQDQDYLNVICKNKVAKIGGEWNEMPVQNSVNPNAKLIHFNLDFKPWHKEGVLYADKFWYYADACPYKKEIYEARRKFHISLLVKAEKETLNLVALAKKEGNDKAENSKITRKINRIFARYATV